MTGKQGMDSHVGDDIDHICSVKEFGLQPLEDLELGIRPPLEGFKLRSHT